MAFGGLKLASTRYGPEAIERYNKLLDTRISRQEQQRLLGELADLAERNPELAALYNDISQRVSVGSGVATGQSQPNYLSQMAQ
jgi:hypothetical protein